MKYFSIVFFITFLTVGIFAFDKKDLQTLKNGDDCTGCDLRNADLHGMYLEGFDLRASLKTLCTDSFMRFFIDEAEFCRTSQS